MPGPGLQKSGKNNPARGFPTNSVKRQAVSRTK
jgi:hypothetical protein